jgi:two-component system, LuxR family, sensor kinase FixL
MGVGVAAALTGALARLILMGYLEYRLAYVTFYPAVEIAALIGGIVSGGLATVLCALMAHLWVAPLVNLGDWLGLAIFLTMATVISGITEALHRTWIRMSDAETRVAVDDHLRVANERLRLAVSAGAIGAWDLDVAANVTEASPEMRDIFGFAPDTLVNPETVFSAILPDDLPAMQATFRAAFDPAGDGEYCAEYRIRRVNDGEERWISAKAQAFFADGRPVRLVGICRDVTDEKSVERLLAEKARLAEQITSVAASVPGVICSFRQSAHGKQSFPYVSGNFSSVYGLSPDEVRADAGPVFRRIHADDLNNIEASIAESARTLTIWRDEFRYEHPQKGTIWLEGQSSPIMEPSGEIIWHGYVQDVTERKRAEEELRASEAKSRAFFELGLIGVIYWNVNGAITDANDKFLEMLGYNRQDLEAGRIDWVRMTPPEYRHIDDAALADVKARGATQKFEKEYFRKDGTRLPVLIAGAMLYASRGDGVAFVLDISERKQAEARMQKLYADRMNVMESMAAGLAHEINQPLTATGSYLKTVRRLLDMEAERRQASVTETLDKAAAQVRRAGQIVSRLREFITHGEPDKIQLKLHELIQDAYDATNIGAKERQIRVTLQLDAKEDEVLADKIQIEQVLVNLIRNAKEAMEAAQRRELVVSTSSNQTDIRVDIADTGVGLSEKAKSDLFEPFVTTKLSGMGVGLSISRAIIEVHHGKIWAESNPDGGAIFSFTLPLAGTQTDT